MAGAAPSCALRAVTTLPASVRLAKLLVGDASAAAAPSRIGVTGAGWPRSVRPRLGVSPVRGGRGWAPRRAGAGCGGGGRAPARTDFSRCAESLVKLAARGAIGCVRASGRGRFCAVPPLRPAGFTFSSTFSNSPSRSKVIGCDAFAEFICIVSHLSASCCAERLYETHSLAQCWISFGSRTSGSSNATSRSVTTPMVGCERRCGRAERRPNSQSTCSSPALA